MEQFSPYKSPVSHLENQSQRNLTGNLRKLKDSTADIHNLIIKWNSHRQEGASLINQIATIKLETGLKKDAHENEQNHSTTSLLPMSLEPKCEALLLIIKSMEKIVSKMEVLVSHMHGLSLLSQHYANTESILFKTWTIRQFVETFESLYRMYAKEFDLKKQLASNVAHASSRETLMFYSAAWLHEPYTDSKLLLESLLLETGHR